MYLCGLVGISRQWYYRSFWSIAQKQAVVEQTISLVNQIRISMPRIGSRKLYYLLYDSLKEIQVGRDKLFKILKANDLLIKPKRNYRTTTNSHHRFRKHKNLIADLEIVHPEQVWVSDITYIGGRGNSYLALITDAYSKKIIGYDLSDSLATKGSLRAWRMAYKNRCYKNTPLIHHSDRGFQYCSNDYQDALLKAKITPSMTESDDPYANAIAERVNGILKQEFLLEDYKVDLEMMKLLVEDAIRIYNAKRPHWSCHMKTPNEMHMQSNLKIKTYKKKISTNTRMGTDL